jgi:hypothetical protein
VNKTHTCPSDMCGSLRRIIHRSEVLCTSEDDYTSSICLIIRDETSSRPNACEFGFPGER